MTLLRGKGLGLEVALAGLDYGLALDELQARLSERPGFYRGSTAIASFGERVPTDAEIVSLRTVLGDGGIVLRAISGATELAGLAEANGLEYVPGEAPGEDAGARRPLTGRRERPVQLSEGARSLAADFAGARAEIAARRKRGEASVRRSEARATRNGDPPALRVVEPLASALYHVGTLRGGQSLHHIGSIVVVGDVNPGAELLASGDVVVFGRLGGVAHAGAQGDDKARVYALDLRATQLRISSFIAADSAARGRGASVPEVALVSGGRIAIVPLARVDEVREEPAR